MTSMRPRALRRCLPLLLALPLAAAGCGDDSSGTGNPAAAPASSATSAASGATGANGAATMGAGSSTAAAGEASQCPPESGTPEPHKSFTQAPPMCLKAGAHYAARLTTDAGAFTVDLDATKAPKTVNNFVFLARNHFYDGITFHRVIPGFMIQGGDPQGTGSGNPGYRFADELPKAGDYKVGSIAMANSGPDTNGSQFFVVTGASGVSLPPQYSLFGQVTEGMDAVKKIESDGSPQGTPKSTHTIQKVEITQH